MVVFYPFLSLLLPSFFVSIHFIIGFPFLFSLLLAGGRAEAALALSVCIVVYRDAVGQENALCERVTRLNRQQLADYLNVDRSALSKELGKMRDEGLIEFRKNAFHLHSIC